MSDTQDSPRPLTADQQALVALRRLRAQVEQLEAARTEPIAIVGLGCRFPGADGPDAYWSLLRDGVDAVSEVPPDRWDIDAYYDPDPDAPGRMSTRFGAFVRDIGGFDPTFFGISPREAVSMDPQQRLMLEIVWEALEHAGIAPSGLAGSDTGVFVGTATHDYGALHLRYGRPEHFDTHFGTGNAPNAVSGRISYVLGLQGPCIAIDTACSSSLVAVHLACQSLRSGECRVALAGGVNAILLPEVTINFSRARMMAADGRCKTFDAAADGYVRGEGAGVVVLKRLSDAVADGDRILALVRGSAVNQDGRSGGFTAPNELAQQAVIRRALSVARLKPIDISYVEAHGTGTSLGDPIEVQALAAVLGEGRTSASALYLGSVKTNFGHLEAAAGVAGLIKVVLSLRHRTIPPHLHFTRPNPYAPLQEIPAVVPVSAVPWQGDAPRRAGISSFGFTGTNSHVIIEEYAATAPGPDAPAAPAHLLTLSARADHALRAQAGRLEVALGAPDAPPLRDVAFTLNVGRSHLSHRAALVARSVDEAREQLRALAAGTPAPGLRAGRPQAVANPDLVFLFTGQGAQYPGMARALYESQPVFREQLDRCASTLAPLMDSALMPAILGEPGAADLNQTGVTQPALFAIEYALAAMWQSWGVAPTAVMGHSVGEYVAACVAGVFSVEDALRLVAARGRLMQRLPPGGGMAAVRADRAAVASVIAPFGSALSIAADNGPGNTVVSGSLDVLEPAVAALEAQGIASTRLVVSHAFHSALMDPVLPEFEEIARAVTFHEPRLPLVSNVSGALAGPGALTTPAYWARHLRAEVRFGPGVRTLYERDYRVFLEIGPTSTLLAMAQHAVPDPSGCAWVPSLQKGRDDWQTVLQALADLYVRDVPLDWAAVGRAMPGRKVALPTYPFQRERYWTDVVPTLRPASADASAQTDATTWLHELVWRPQASAGFDAPRVSGNSTWVVFADGGGVGDVLAEQLAARRAHVVRVRPGSRYAFDAPGSAAIRPGADEDMRRLWTALGTAGRAVEGVVHLWSLDSPPAADLTTPALRDWTRDNCASLLHVAQAVAAQEAHTQICVVTRQAVAVDGEAVCVTHATASGLAVAIATELPTAGGLHIDLDASATPAGDAGTVWESLAAVQGAERRVAVRRGSRFVPRLIGAVPVAGAATSVVRADATYVVTGGLGALGLLTAQWLADQGARHLVLIGRRAAGDGVAAALRSLRNAGVTVDVARGDVSDAAFVEELVGRLAVAVPPLRGVVHAAGVLDDGVLSRQTWTRMAGVMAPKVQGAWNLHRATAGVPLDFFVMYSSAVAVLGAAGQSSYIAANTFLDALAHLRRAQGLAATSINWGPWQQVGMAAATGDREARRWSTRGIDLIAPERGIALLDTLMSRDRPAQVTVLPVDWARFTESLAGSPLPMVSELVGAARATSLPKVARDTDQDWRSAPVERRVELVSARVRDLAAAVLNLAPDRTEDLDRSLFDLGLDSLLALELRNALERALGVSLPVVELMDGATMRTLPASVLQRLAHGVTDEAAPEQGLSSQDAQLLARIPEMSDADVDALLASLQADRRPD